MKKPSQELARRLRGLPSRNDLPLRLVAHLPGDAARDLKAGGNRHAGTPGKKDGVDPVHPEVGEFVVY